ncbi:MAG: hypothetical protein LBQ28_04205 [Prevotellaceae bacterium]|nr:hypothetical protein [Prevotellaceae bacterium]
MFNKVLKDSNSNKIKAYAYCGLGLTYYTEGKTGDAIKNMQKSAELGYNKAKDWLKEKGV